MKVLVTGGSGFVDRTWFKRSSLQATIRRCSSATRRRRRRLSETSTSHPMRYAGATSWRDAVNAALEGCDAVALCQRAECLAQRFWWPWWRPSSPDAASPMRVAPQTLGWRTQLRARSRFLQVISHLRLHNPRCTPTPGSFGTGPTTCGPHSRPMATPARGRACGGASTSPAASRSSSRH
jgi:hypothetical protein